MRLGTESSIMESIDSLFIPNLQIIFSISHKRDRRVLLLLFKVVLKRT